MLLTTRRSRAASYVRRPHCRLLRITRGPPLPSLLHPLLAGLPPYRSPRKLRQSQPLSRSRPPALSLVSAPSRHGPCPPTTDASHAPVTICLGAPASPSEIQTPRPSPPCTALCTDSAWCRLSESPSAGSTCLHPVDPPQHAFHPSPALRPSAFSLDSSDYSH